MSNSEIYRYIEITNSITGKKLYKIQKKVKKLSWFKWKEVWIDYEESGIGIDGIIFSKEIVAFNNEQDAKEHVDYLHNRNYNLYK
jgi:hypothetical protein